jgi:hypothetical protein
VLGTFVPGVLWSCFSCTILGHLQCKCYVQHLYNHTTQHHSVTRTDTNVTCINWYYFWAGLWLMKGQCTFWSFFFRLMKKHSVTIGHYQSEKFFKISNRELSIIAVKVMKWAWSRQRPKTHVNFFFFFFYGRDRPIFLKFSGWCRIPWSILNSYHGNKK